MKTLVKKLMPVVGAVVIMNSAVSVYAMQGRDQGPKNGVPANRPVVHHHRQIPIQTNPTSSFNSSTTPTSATSSLQASTYPSFLPVSLPTPTIDLRRMQSKLLQPQQQQQQLLSSASLAAASTVLSSSIPKHSLLRQRPTHAQPSFSVPAAAVAGAANAPANQQQIDPVSLGCCGRCGVRIDNFGRACCDSIASGVVFVGNKCSNVWNFTIDEGKGILRLAQKNKVYLISIGVVWLLMKSVLFNREGEQVAHAAINQFAGILLGVLAVIWAIESGYEIVHPAPAQQPQQGQPQQQHQHAQ